MPSKLKGLRPAIYQSFAAVWLNHKRTHEMYYQCGDMSAIDVSYLNVYMFYLATTKLELQKKSKLHEDVDVQ